MEEHIPTLPGRINYLAPSIIIVEVYERMARLYDLIYCDEVDLSFYLREAKNARGPVLEAACGTGRIMLRLLSEKVDVSGIDISKAMIDVLKRKAAAMGLKPDVHVSDMADFKLGKEFSLIIVPYRSFLHIENEPERKKVLDNLFQHLKKGGRLILHTYNPSEDEMAMTDGYHLIESEHMFTPEGKPYNLVWLLRYEPKGRVGNYKIKISFDTGGKDEFDMRIHYIPIKDLRTLLSSSGFKNIKLYCGFDYSDFDDDCREAVWIAEK